MDKQCGNRKVSEIMKKVYWPEYCRSPAPWAARTLHGQKRSWYSRRASLSRRKRSSFQSMALCVIVFFRLQRYMRYIIWHCDCKCLIQQYSVCELYNNAFIWNQRLKNMLLHSMCKLQLIHLSYLNSLFLIVHKIVSHITLAKEMCFNGARKHQKIEDERYFTTPIFSVLPFGANFRPITGFPMPAPRRLCENGFLSCVRTITIPALLHGLFCGMKLCVRS